MRARGLPGSVAVRGARSAISSFRFISNRSVDTPLCQRGAGGICVGSLRAAVDSGRDAGPGEIPLNPLHFQPFR